MFRLHVTVSAVSLAGGGKVLHVTVFPAIFAEGGEVSHVTVFAGICDGKKE